MSFVREIVESNALVTIDMMTNEMPKLLADSLKLKEKSLNYIETVYVKFACRPQTDHKCHEMQQLLDRGQTLEASIEEVVKVEVHATKQEITQCTKRLQQIHNNLSVSYSFIHHHELLQQAKHHIEVQEFMKAAEILCIFQTAKFEEYKMLMQKLQEHALVVQRTFISRLVKMIKKHFEYTCSETDTLSTYSLQVKANNDQVQQAILALAVIGRQVFNELQLLIWKMLTCIVQNSSQVNISEGECAINGKRGHRNNYDAVFENLCAFAVFLNKSLCYQLNTKQTLMEFIREDTDEKLSTLIVKDCLEHTIPDTEAGLETYHKVEKMTIVLQRNLIESGLLNAGNTHLTDYVTEVNVHFVNKRCEHFMAIAVDLMQKDLHHTVNVGVPYDPTDMSFNGFAQCAISKAVLELLQLVKQMIEKEITSAGGSSGYYVLSAKDILAQYEACVKHQHHRLLQTIPQQMAIFYNNCRYIAHELTTPHWQELMQQLPPALQQFEGFTVVAQLLNDSAVQMLDSIINEQVADIKGMIDAAGIHRACDKLEPAAEKAVRQCLRQQELLKTVWQKVLNYYDYNRSVGVLLDALSKATAENIMRISDIPSDVCDQLVDILKLIATRGPKLFTDPKEIHMYVEHWGKLNEVMFVLNSGLTSIRERWADGKGPLALHFTPDEMRMLIRALFQNSDERAALLSVILVV